MKKGFTLIEMLVVIGIILVLMGASVAGFSRMTKSAERAKAQELVSNVNTALTALFQKDGVWPEALRKNGGSDGLLDADRALVLSRKGYLVMTMNSSKTKLEGYDQFGLVTPWAMAAIRRQGSSATESTKVSNGRTVREHTLHYALDLDGDGVVEASVGGESVKIRATAAVWCIGKDGGNKGSPWPYSEGKRRGDVYSWADGQTKKVN